MLRRKADKVAFSTLHGKELGALNKVLSKLYDKSGLQEVLFLFLRYFKSEL